MTETGNCPLNNCDGQCYLLFDGSVYCPTCEEVYNADHVLSDKQVESYDEAVQDVVDEDLDEIYAEHVRLLDMYYKEPIGFPDRETHRRFQVVFPLLVTKFIDRAVTREEARRQAKEALERAQRRARI